MYLKKILNNKFIQGYTIVNPTNKFKSMYPKKYIFAICLNNNTKVIISDNIPIEFAYLKPHGYIFTYNKTLPGYINIDDKEEIDIGRTYPVCLDKYFINSNIDKEESKEIDLILCCSAYKEITPRLTNKLLIKCNVKNLLDTNNIRKSIMNIINSSISGKYTVESWINDILANIPLNYMDCPFCYPETINSKCLNSKSKIKYTDIFVEYDIRATSYEEENKFINTLEESFENMDEEVIIHNNYNNILSTIIKELDKHKLKYTKIRDDCISVTLKNINKINVEYKLNDFL